MLIKVRGVFAAEMSASQTEKEKQKQVKPSCKNRTQQLVMTIQEEDGR